MRLMTAQEALEERDYQLLSMKELERGLRKLAQDFVRGEEVIAVVPSDKCVTKYSKKRHELEVSHPDELRLVKKELVERGYEVSQFASGLESAGFLVFLIESHHQK